MRFFRLAIAPALVALAITSLPGCAAETSEEASTEEDLKGVTKASVAKANNAFATSLYAELRKEEGNVFYSPYSISTALAMTYAGAAGRTATSMREALHLPSGNVHTGFQALGAELASRPEAAPGKLQLSIANALFGEKSQPFAPAFVKTVTTSYGAAVEQADFRRKPDAERKRINDWVADKTNDKIEDLLPEGILKSDTKLVLVNAIYFKAAWQSPFDARNTEKEPFTALDGSTKKVPMMGYTRQLSFARTAAYDAVALPYAGGELELLAIAPTAGTFADFEAGLSAEKLDRIVGGMTSQRVRLGLPKFKIDGASVRLKEQLTKLGMGDAFTDAADLRGITGSNDTKIGEVVHKAFIAVDEAGTEAAAATAVIGISKASMPKPAIDATFDRPFVFAIRDTATGTVLFLGRVTKL